MRAIISAFLIGTLKLVINLSHGDGGYLKSENEEWTYFANLMLTECFI